MVFFCGDGVLSLILSYAIDILSYYCNDTLSVKHNLFVGKTQDVKSKSGQIISAAFIPKHLFLLRMICAIDLNDQFLVQTDGIGYIFSNDVLPVELTP